MLQHAEHLCPSGASGNRMPTLQPRTLAENEALMAEPAQGLLLQTGNPGTSPIPCIRRQLPTTAQASMRHMQAQCLQGCTTDCDERLQSAAKTARNR
mmetsp:Transcript_101788/g.323451  ORF Transcript_101788/g.323451 Transcript_101788/m.323451 type:complete len:97 (-) Transcript_101788:129-419(-)